MPEAEIRKLELDEEDGRLIYELKFLDGNGLELEAELDAYTGEILKWEVD